MSTNNKKEQQNERRSKKKKDNNVNDKNVRSSKEDITKRHKTYYKFDMDRCFMTKNVSDSKCMKTSAAKYEAHMKDMGHLFQAEIDRMTYVHENTVPLNLGYIIFDHTKYNLLFKHNLDCDPTQSHLQQFIQMSVEKNEFKANIYYNNLIKANWSPAFRDIQNILINWGAKLNTLMNKPVLKCQVNNCNAIRWCNFELIMNYITHVILEEINDFSNTDLLTLAKYAVTISFDHHLEQMIIVIKQLFNSCIKMALSEDDNTAIIEFAQELYSKHTKDDLQKIIVYLFLPFEGSLMKKMYSYIAFKLYNSYLGDANNINTFPTDINIWFVQYLVNKDYFIENPMQLDGVIRLLDHIVISFNLYQDEENLGNMYAFLYNFVKPIGISSQLVNILDRWRLGLFHLQVSEKNKLY